jgi:hypothetical protein
MIHPDVLARLPDASRQKLLLLDGMSDESLDIAQSAQGRLNDLARRYPGAEANSTVARLGAVIADAEHRREDLFRLISACAQWVRSVPEPALPLEAVTDPPPPLEHGETPEDAVMKIRREIAELTVERLEVAQLPEPKPIIMAAFRAEVSRLATATRPRLDFTRGRARPVFQAADFISPEFVFGALAWFDGARMLELLDQAVEAEIDDAAEMASDEQQTELARLDGEIEALGRQEEALIDAAFEKGVDILRRANASPPCVLAVRLPKPVVAARPMRRPRPGGPVAELSLADAKAAE